MHALPGDSEPAFATCRFARSTGSVKPHAPPMRSHSRRSRPSQSRVGESRTESMESALRQVGGRAGCPTGGIDRLWATRSPARRGKTMDLNLKDHVAVVTGGASGIGAAVV